MTSLWISIFAAVIVFVGGVGGFYPQRLLPQPHVEQSRGMIGAVVGLITLLQAPALGTIVGSEKRLPVAQNVMVERKPMTASFLTFSMGLVGLTTPAPGLKKYCPSG
jgi:hypothetical protein